MFGGGMDGYQHHNSGQSVQLVIRGVKAEQSRAAAKGSARNTRRPRTSLCRTLSSGSWPKKVTTRSHTRPGLSNSCIQVGTRGEEALG